MKGCLNINNIIEYAQYFQTFLGKKFKFCLENSLIIEFYFTAKSFYHIIGLHKLDDITVFNNSSLLFNLVHDKTISQKIEKSVKYFLIEPRIKHFEEIKNIFDKNQCEFIIDFNKDLVRGETELKNTKYLLYKRPDKNKAEQKAQPLQ